MHQEKAKITCPAFQKQEQVIKGITERINKVRKGKERVALAGELQKEADVLLLCADFDEQALDCQSCHFLAKLRRKTAGLIITAKKLTE